MPVLELTRVRRHCVVVIEDTCNACAFHICIHSTHYADSLCIIMHMHTHDTICMCTLHMHYVDAL